MSPAERGGSNPQERAAKTSSSGRLAEAIRVLQAATAQHGSLRAVGDQPVAGPGEPPADAEAAADQEQRAYLAMLEHNGQVVNVSSRADLSHLPPHVTHVRWPDGSIERVGFST